MLAEASKLFAGAPDWLSREVLICGAAAVLLLVLSLLLRGLQKLISLGLVVAVVLCGCWFLRDAWRNKAKFLPASVATELDTLADKTLHSPQAQAAWNAAKQQFARLTGSTAYASSTSETTGPAAGDPQHREALASELAARAATLRKQGDRTAAEELLRLRDRLRE